MDLNLTDKIALITGASRGIGREILLQLGKQGAKVVGTATSDKGAAAISAVIEEHQLNGFGLRLDVTDADSVAQALQEIAERLGAPAVLVNNAGITRDNLLLRLGEEDWQSIIDTNLSSIYRMSRACLRAMVKARWGRIINIGSVVGSAGNPGQANYAAAKAGLIGFSKALAIEIAQRGITVNVVAPGFIDTDMTRALNEEQQAAIMQSIPMQRLGQAEEIAQVVGFLASPAAAYVTGQTLHVNGGMYMG